MQVNTIVIREMHVGEILYEVGWTISNMHICYKGISNYGDGEMVFFFPSSHSHSCNWRLMVWTMSCLIAANKQHGDGSIAGSVGTLATSWKG